MKISKIVYLSLLLIIVSLIFAFCLKILFFSSTNKSTLASNNKSVLETNTKYFDEIYSEYKKMNQSRKVLLTEKQFFNIFHCFFVISQLELIDYVEMIIYILKNNPILTKNFILKFKDNLIDGFLEFFGLENEYFLKKYSFENNQEELDAVKEFEKLESEILELLKKIKNQKSNLQKLLQDENIIFFQSEQNLTNLKNFNKLKNGVKAIFEFTSLNIQHFHNILPLFDIYITDEKIFIHNLNIIMKPALLYAIDFIKLNWSKNLSTDMAKNFFLSEFVKLEGTFSYFYISLYSWIYYFDF